MTKKPTTKSKDFEFKAHTENKPAPKSEDKRARFVRMALPRVNRAVNAIRLIGNLSGPVYKSTPQDLDQIKAALIEAIGEALDRFEKPVREPRAFTLKH